MADSSLREMVVSTAQSTALYAISNVCGQLIEGWRRHQPVRFDWIEFLRFVAATTLLNPPCFYWQHWMERNWPGEDGQSVGGATKPGVRAGGVGSSGGTYELVPQDFELDDFDGELDVHEDRESLENGRGIRRRSVSESTRSNAEEKVQISERDTGKRKMIWKNVAIKWVLDNSLGGLWYTVGFIFFIELFKWKGLRAVGEAIVNDTASIILPGFLIWAVATLVNFIFVPVGKRVVFIAWVGLFWGIYLSVFEAEPDKETDTAKTSG